MRVLLFSPHAGIWTHTFLESLVADAVRTAGAELIHVTCGGALSEFCVTMSAFGLKPDSPTATKQAVCVKCRASRDRVRRGFNFTNSFDFESVLNSADRARVEAVLAAVRPGEIAALEVDGIAIGRAALYEFVIEHKKIELALTAEEWRVFRPRLGNAVRSLIAAGKILDREQPRAVLCYSTLYSVNAAWRLQADARGIATYFVHAGISLKDRLQQVLVGRDSSLAWSLRVIEAWPRFRDVPCSAAELAPVTEHFLQLFGGNNVLAYSAAKAATAQDVRARFGVAAGQKLVVATMSSYDEYMAAAAIGEMPAQDTLLFPTQIEWIRALTTWARKRPDVFVLVRVHPREFPNRREGRKSEHAVLLERELADLPANVRVNWPTDKLSIYDIAEEADVILNAWSSAGKEMTLLGLPVVTYCPTLLLYTPELHYVGTTADTYFAAIDEALRDGWSFERTRMAFRWHVLEFERGLADIHDAWDRSEEDPHSLRERIRNAILAQPAIGERRDLWRRPRVLTEQHRLGELVMSGAATLLEVASRTRQLVALEAETRALRREMVRLIDALYGSNTASPAKGSLRAKLIAAAA